MSKTTPKQNKALVLEAFDTLFNKRDYKLPNAIGRTATSNTARILRPAATVYSTSSVRCQTLRNTKTISSSPKGTS